MESGGYKKKLVKLIPYAVILLIIFLFFPTPIMVLYIVGCILFQLFKRRSDVFALIGNLSYYKGNMTKAMKWFELSSRSGKPKTKNVLLYAYLLLRQGNIEDSEKVTNKLLNSKLEHNDLMLVKSNQALILWKKGNLEEAVALLEEVFTTYKNTTVYGSLGYLLILKGDLDKALEFNLEAFDYNRTNTIILDNLGFTYYHLGDYEKALEMYDKLMALNPSYSEAYYNYGLVLLKLNNVETALASMEKALNYKITFLSSVPKEKVESDIENIKEILKKS